MAMLEIVQIPVLQDNYLYLIHDPASGNTAIVDPAVEDPVVAELDKHGWTLTHILNTHHHWDHTGANLALKERYGLTVIGPKADKDRIPGIDVCVDEGDTVSLGQHRADVYFVPGHTSGHIAYHFAEADALFCGDTLFSMGCGRLFEGTPKQMWDSISKLMRLPDETRIFCAHEYTTANGNFALSVEPKNAALIARMAEVTNLRAEDKPTVPTTMALEKSINPFMRPMSEEIQQNVNLAGAALADVFAEVRKRKDSF